jgi:hypothetical protein
MVENQVKYYLINKYLIFIRYFKGFVRSSQALEIISLIFYIVASILIFGGIIIGGEIYEFLFGGAALLLFICSMF